VKRYGGFMIGFIGSDDLERIDKLKKIRRQKRGDNEKRYK
jgi:hypothetical protein